MDYEILKTELDAGHPVTGAYSANDKAAAGELIAVNIQQKVRVSKADIEDYFLENDVYHLIAGQTAGDAGTIATKIKLLFASRRNDVDVTRPPVAQGLAALVAGGLLTQAQADEVKAMGVKMVSRAEELGLIGLNDTHITHARSL